jgi:hypothetical protein
MGSRWEHIHYEEARRMPFIYFFKFPKTESWREKCTEKKWLMIKEERGH